MAKKATNSQDSGAPESSGAISPDVAELESKLGEAAAREETLKADLTAAREAAERLSEQVTELQKDSEKLAAALAEIESLKEVIEDFQRENVKLDDQLQLALGNKKVELQPLPKQASLADCNKSAEKIWTQRRAEESQVSKLVTDAAAKVAKQSQGGA